MEGNSGAKSGVHLKKCELKGVEDTGRELVQGCYYAKATEVTYKGLRCLARTVSPECLGATALVAGGRDGGGSGRAERSAEQLEHLYDCHCAKLLELRHPHLLQFMGIRYEHGQQLTSLALVSEQLPLNLAEALDQYGRLPESLSYSVLKDVALGMVYLHSRSPTPVIHGELAAHNVFLATDLTAKIADMGVSSLFSLTPSRRKSIGYAALAHLPPESLALPSAERSPSRSAQIMLNKKLDSYSFGVLMIHVLSGRFPECVARRAHSLCGTVLKDSSSSSSPSSCVNGVEEILGGVSMDHPLSSLLLQCLNQVADSRPDLSQTLSTLSELMLQFSPLTLTRRLELLQRVVQASSSSAANSSASGGRGGGNKPLARKESITTLANCLEIEHLKLQIQELHVENRGLRLSLAKQREIVSARDQEMAAKLMAKDQEIASKYQELSAQEAMVEAYKATVSAKERTLSVLNNQMQHLHNFIANKHEVSRGEVRKCGGK